MIRCRKTELRSKGAQVTVILVVLLTLIGSSAVNADASSIVVGHDINTLATSPTIPSGQEPAFAVNVATFLTSGSASKNLLLFESNPGDAIRNFAPSVLTALTNAGFALTVTSNYATPFTGFDAIFVAQDFPVAGFLNNSALISYVNAGGSVYLAGGVGTSAAVEAAGWSTFLNNYGLAFATSYNGLSTVAITSVHPIFAGITNLGSGNGQSIINLGTNPNAQIVQFAGTQGVYAVVNVAGTTTVPEPPTYLLSLTGVLGLLGYAWRERKLNP